MNKYFLLLAMAIVGLTASCEKDPVVDPISENVLRATKQVAELRAEFNAYTDVLNVDGLSNFLHRLNNHIVGDLNITGADALSNDIQSAIDNAIETLRIAAETAATEQGRIDTLNSGQVLFAFENGELVVDADGVGVLIDIDGNVLDITNADDVKLSHEGYIARTIELMEAILNVWEDIVYRVLG